ncbi:MAG: FGGY-family carbohydrate kinase [Actinobacteria bacterium]|nr:FGGY-family carbohydrate kinase [Actinomycetota bacterium]
MWCQIKSDVCNINLEVPEYTETALLGAAVMAAWGSGIFKDIKSASKNLIRIKETYYPNKNNFNIYNNNYKKYKELYKNVKKLF